jgi:formylglycine-generating enzyme required for sulfatase activity
VILEGNAALRLVFLNACAGARAAEHDAFQGTAQHLVQQGVPVVVAMQFDIVSTSRGGAGARVLPRRGRWLPGGGRTHRGAQGALHRRRRAGLGDPGDLHTRGDNRLVETTPPCRSPELDEQPAPPTPRLPFEPEMVSIPAGAVTMGASAAPVHGANTSSSCPAFGIGKYPITNAQYAAFVRQQPDRRPLQSGWFFTTPPADRLDHPVAGITWHDAAAYCALAGGAERTRLPSAD